MALTNPPTHDTPLTFDRPAPPTAVDWRPCGLWPCRWIHVEGSHDRPLFAAYRLAWRQNESRVVQVFVTADERYELFLDGRRLGRGPQRGAPGSWRYEAYDLHLTPGPHLLTARVWSLGDMAPWAQLSARHGFLLQPREADLDAVLGTGLAPWEARRCGEIRAIVDPRFTPVGPSFEIDGAEPARDSSEERWHAALPAHHGAHAKNFNNEQPLHLLVPAELPAMLDEPVPLGDLAVVRFVAKIAADQDVDTLPVDMKQDLPDERRRWQDMLAGRSSVRVEPGHARRVILDLQNYFCAYPAVTLSGGAGGVVELGWVETLLTQCNRWEGKERRGPIDGRYFNGLTDRFLAPGGSEARRFEVPWWRAGRFVQIVVRCPGSQAVEVLGLELRETRYPLEMQGRFTCRSSDKTWPAGIAAMIPVALRGLQMCAHETYLDCPYYEQLMYVGDTRLQALAGYAISPDDRLQRKALTTFDISRRPDGVTQSRYPCRPMQIIPPFSLWWVGMVHDFALWRDDPGHVRGLLPGVHAVLEAFLHHQRPDGLVDLPGGWNFTDWVAGWRNGVGPSGPSGVSGLVNWQLVLALQEAAELDNQAGEPELAARWRRLANQIGSQLVDHFWDESRGLLADDLEHEHFSEHSQAMAVLAGMLSDAQTKRVMRALEGYGVQGTGYGDHQSQQPGSSAPPVPCTPYPVPLARTSIYFSHYLLEAFARLGRMDLFFDRLRVWFSLKDLDLKTTPERMHDPVRSDCHGWGGHPLYHVLATVAGIRPTAWGFRQIRITPRLGPLEHLRAAMPHPAGESIDVEFERRGDSLGGTIRLPAGVAGELVLGSGVIALQAGGETRF